MIKLFLLLELSCTYFDLSSHSLCAVLFQHICYDSHMSLMRDVLLNLSNTGF